MALDRRGENNSSIRIMKAEAYGQRRRCRQRKRLWTRYKKPSSSSDTVTVKITEDRAKWRRHTRVAVVLLSLLYMALYDMAIPS